VGTAGGTAGGSVELSVTVVTIGEWVVGTAGGLVELSVTVPKCLGSEVSRVRSVLTPQCSLVPKCP